MYDIFYKIELATQQWRLAHQPIYAAGTLQAFGVEENGGGLSTQPQQSSLIANDGTREGQHAPAEHGENPDPAAPITFADVPLGEEFVDEHGCTWEKRSEKRAISWIQYEPPEVADFSPTDPVRLK